MIYFTYYHYFFDARIDTVPTVSHMFISDIIVLVSVSVGFMVTGNYNVKD